MLIHSIIHPECLLSLPEAPIRSVRPWKSGWLEGFEENGSFRIQRIISTDLGDYLNPKLNPGQILSYKQENIKE